MHSGDRERSQLSLIIGSPQKPTVLPLEAAVSEAETMTTADDIRKFCVEHFVQPARARGEHAVTLRAGDVHNAMGLAQRLPAVCAALGSDTFERLARVRRLAIDGPLNGASTLFVFKLT